MMTTQKAPTVLNLRPSRPGLFVELHLRALPAIPPSQLGQALRQCLKAGGRTQVQVGKAAGLLPKTVAGLERTPGRSQIGNLFKLISALGMELVLRPKVDEDRQPPASEW